MSSKIACYLRTHRRQWGLTQKELASLIPKGHRARISKMERGLTPPRAAELLAIAFIFGEGPHKVFPRYMEELVDAVMQAASRLDLKLSEDASPVAQRKRELLQQLPHRAP